MPRQRTALNRMEDVTAYDPLTAPDPKEWQELDAFHAIGNVLAGYIHELLRGPEPREDPNEAYYDRLGKLTAEGWRQQFE